MKAVYNEIHSVSETQDVYREMYNILRRNIDYAMIFQGKIAASQSTGLKEIILSEYFGA